MSHMQQNQYLLPATVLGVALVLSSALGAYTFYAVRSFDNVLTVTGSAKRAVTADSAKWRLTILRKVGESGVPQGYSQVARDADVLLAFLTKNGIPESAITTMPIGVDELYRAEPYPREYQVRQEVIIQSNDVHAVDALSKRIGELAPSGIFVSNNWLEFYVTNLPELRVSLLAAAVTDARARAEQIAVAGGQSVGSLKSASSGVVQVLAPNSIDVSDYGQYDTQSIEKEVMVTARATFFVR